MRSRILRGWLVIGAGEIAAMLLAVGAALRLTGWVLRPVRVLDATTHDIATGRLKSRVAAAGGPPELRRLARSFNEMADNVEDVLEQQRAFVADASHQLRNPLSALLLRIELLALELPEGNEEIASVQAEGKRLAQVLDDLLDLALAEHAEADAAADRHRRAGRRARRRLGADRRGQGRPAGGRLPAHHRLGRPGRPVQRAGRGDRQRGQVHPRATSTVEVTVASDGGTPPRSRSPTTGPGLTEDELARVGDRFWRSGRHQNVKGSGLGLSISRALLAAGGGSIAYGHHEPHGLRVTVTVPAAAPPHADDRASRLDRAVVAPGALVQGQRVGVDRGAQVHAAARSARACRCRPGS